MCVRQSEEQGQSAVGRDGRVSWRVRRSTPGAAEAEQGSATDVNVDREKKVGSDEVPCMQEAANTYLVSDGVAFV